MTEEGRPSHVYIIKPPLSSATVILRLETGDSCHLKCLIYLQCFCWQSPEGTHSVFIDINVWGENNLAVQCISVTGSHFTLVNTHIQTTNAQTLRNCFVCLTVTSNDHSYFTIFNIPEQCFYILYYILILYCKLIIIWCNFNPKLFHIIIFLLFCINLKLYLFWHIGL